MDVGKPPIRAVPAAIWLGHYELLDMLTDVGTAVALDNADPRRELATRLAQVRQRWHRHWLAEWQV